MCYMIVFGKLLCYFWEINDVIMSHYLLCFQENVVLIIIIIFKKRSMSQEILGIVIWHVVSVESHIEKV
jgi:hypothetical protein